MPGAHLCNVVHGGRTPMLPREELAALGFAGVLYANAALQAAMLAMQRTLEHLQRAGSLAGIEDRLLGFAARQQAVGLQHWLDLERRYGVEPVGHAVTPASSPAGTAPTPNPPPAPAA